MVNGRPRPDQQTGVVSPFLLQGLSAPVIRGGCLPRRPSGLSAPIVRRGCPPRSVALGLSALFLSAGVVRPGSSAGVVRPDQPNESLCPSLLLGLSAPLVREGCLRCPSFLFWLAPAALPSPCGAPPPSSSGSPFSLGGWVGAEKSLSVDVAPALRDGCLSRMLSCCVLVTRLRRPFHESLA
jgi:hypothetical protein